MPDREKVISRLQIIRTWAAVGKDPIYNGIEPRCCEDIVTWIDDALALLKEQEAVEPLRPRARGRVERFWVCGECGAEIDKGDRFCRYCGRETKWED